VHALSPHAYASEQAGTPRWSQTLGTQTHSARVTASWHRWHVVKATSCAHVPTAAHIAKSVKRGRVCVIQKPVLLPFSTACRIDALVAQRNVRRHGTNRTRHEWYTAPWTNTTRHRTTRMHTLTHSGQSVDAVPPSTLFIPQTHENTKYTSDHRVPTKKHTPKVKWRACPKK
jgi:hypothetical protein